MTWILFSILTALTWAMVNIIDKYVLTKWIKWPVVPVMILGVVGLAFSAVIYLLHGFEPMTTAQILWAFASGFFYILMIYFYFKAVQIEEISRVIPLFYLGPLFILVLAAIFLGESLSPNAYAGVVLLVLGSILISFKGSIRVSFGKAFWLVMLSAFTFAISQVITEYLLESVDYWTIFSYSRIGVFLILVPIFLMHGKLFFRMLKEKGTKAVAVVSFNEVLNMMGLLFLTIAASIGYITVVNALSSLQPLFVLLLTIFISVFYPKILKEELGKSTLILKFVSVAMMITGVVLVS